MDGVFKIIADKLLQIIVSMFGGIVVGINTAVPWMGFCFLLILIDVISAVHLSKRVKKAYPDSGASGKFESKYKTRVMWTIIVVFIAIILGNYIDLHLLDGGRTAESSVVWIFIFYEVWSIVENWSSENNNKIARALQRVMVNKAERHTNTPLADIFFNDQKPKDDDKINGSDSCGHLPEQ